MSTFFGLGTAKAKDKTELSSTVKSTSLSPEDIVTSPNFNLIDGVLVGAVTITPTMAEVWLERNTDNIRNPMRPSIGEYTEAMKLGQWDFNGDPIRFDKKGILVDGQNRLLSCVQSGKSFTSVVVYGIESALNIDVGRKRTLAQLVAHEGFSDGAQISAAINGIYNFRAKNGTSLMQVGHGEKPLTKADAIKFAQDNGTALIHSVNATKQAGKLFGKWGVHSTLHFLFAEKAGQVLADTFYEMLSTGANLGEASPIRHLMLRLNANKGDKHSKLSLNAYVGIVVKCWNAWVSGQEMRRLTYSYEKEGVAKIRRSPVK